MAAHRALGSYTRRIEVAVHLVARDRDGKVLNNAHGRHVYDFRDDLVRRMDIEDKRTPPNHAATAAGSPRCRPGVSPPTTPWANYATSHSA